MAPVPASSAGAAQGAYSSGVVDATSPWFDRGRALGRCASETGEPTDAAAARVAAAGPGAETPDESRSPEVRAFPWFGAAEP